MILNHLFGIYANPKEEWQSISHRKETPTYAISHIALIALIPSLVAYYSSAHIGWDIGAGDLIYLTQASAVKLGVGMYFGLLVGVFMLAIMIHQLAATFDAKPTITQSLELSAYTATPLFMVGFAGLYPELWFIMTVGFFGLAYSVYLLYAGVPILMNIPEEKGFIYSSTVVTCGLVLLVILMAASVMIWSVGLGPVYKIA